MAGTADADVFVLLDSISAGVHGIKGTVNVKNTSWPTQLAQLTAAGLQARHRSFTSNEGVVLPADISAFDPRATFDTSADWTTNPSIASLGDVMLRSNSPLTSRVNFQVPDPIDTVRVVLGCFSAVAIGLYLDNSPTPIRS